MFKRFLPVLFLVSASSVIASSVGTMPCTTATLQSYETSYAPPSHGCSVGILDYSNFSYAALQNAPSTSDVEVSLSSTGQGLSFSQAGGAPFVANGDIIQFAIYYNIAIDPAPVIPGADTHLDPPSGNVSITQYFCNDSVLYPGTTSCFPSSFPVYSLTVTTASPNASVTFNPPAQHFETVGVIFTLDGTNGPASFDGLDSNTTTTALPEPASLLLVGLFMVAGGGYKLNQRRKI